MIALLPHAELDTGKTILAQRLKEQGRPESLENIDYYLTRLAYTELAHRIVYTHNQRPADTCMEILRGAGLA